MKIPFLPKLENSIQFYHQSLVCLVNLSVNIRGRKDYRTPEMKSVCNSDVIEEVGKYGDSRKNSENTWTLRVYGPQGIFAYILS